MAGEMTSWGGGARATMFWGAGTGLNGALALKDLPAGFRSDVI
jgi:hypothetical protein